MATGCRGEMRLDVAASGNQRSRRTWMSMIALVVAGVVVAALGLPASLPASAQGDAIDALATQAVIEAQATAGALAAGRQAVNAQAQAAAAAAAAETAAGAATRQAGLYRAAQAEAAATSQAALLAATLQAGATRQALEVQSTRQSQAATAQALDGLATAQAAVASATAQAIQAAADAQATSQAQAATAASEAAAATAIAYVAAQAATDEATRIGMAVLYTLAALLVAMAAAVTWLVWRRLDGRPVRFSENGSSKDLAGLDIIDITPSVVVLPPAARRMPEVKVCTDEALNAHVEALFDRKESEDGHITPA